MNVEKMRSLFSNEFSFKIVVVVARGCSVRKKGSKQRFKYICGYFWKLCDLNIKGVLAVFVSRTGRSRV